MTVRVEALRREALRLRAAPGAPIAGRMTEARRLHITVDPYRALCGVVLRRIAGDPRGQWWWTDTGEAGTRPDIPPSPAEVAEQDGLVVCPDCAAPRCGAPVWPRDRCGRAAGHSGACLV